jgi:hypothetical protein
VPSFTSVSHGALVENMDIEALLHTAETVMGRRGQVLTEAHRVLYRGLFESTAAGRRQAIREAAQRLIAQQWPKGLCRNELISCIFRCKSHTPPGPPG